MLTERQKQIIAKIVSDEETGKHLIRSDFGWVRLGIKKEDYNAYKERIHNNIKNFNLLDVFNNGYDKETFEMMIYYMTCSDYNFYNDLKKLIE